MKITKKILTGISLASMGIAVAMLIGAIFGLNIFESEALHLLLSLAAVAFASGFAISSVNLMNKQKIVSVISLLLLAASLTLGLITIWSGFNVGELFNKVTITIAVTTIFFIIIVSSSIKLSNRYKLLQALTFILIIIIDIIITLSVWGVNVFGIKYFIEIFCVLCLLAFAMLCTLGVLGKRVPDGEQTTPNKVVAPTQPTSVPKQALSSEEIVISKSEYDSMIMQIRRLQDENIQLRNNR